MILEFTRRGLLAATAGFTLIRAASAQPAQELTIGLSSTSFGTAGARLAKELGLFAKQGLDARFVVMESGNAATTAIISGSLNVVLSGPGELVVAQARGQKVVNVANTFGGASASLVLDKGVASKFGVRPNAAIDDRLKALDGLVLASTTATSSSTVSYNGAAKAAGANVRFVYMAQPAMAAALERGAIQGYVAGAPFWAVPVVKGKGVLWISGPKGDLPPEHTPASAGNMQTMRGFAEANPELVQKLVSVFAELAKFIDEHPEEARAGLARVYPELDAETITLLFDSEKSGWKARPLTPSDIRKEIAFVKASGNPLPQIDQIDPASMLFP